MAVVLARVAGVLVHGQAFVREPPARAAAGGEAKVEEVPAMDWSFLCPPRGARAVGKGRGKDGKAPVWPAGVTSTEARGLPP